MSGALRRSFRAICRLAACWLLMQPLASAAEQIWEIQGEFVSLKAGDPTSVVLRTSSGGQIELPLAAFSANAQAVIRDLSQPGAAPLAVKGVAAPAADLPPALAEDLASCRTAADAADVCHLALANVEVVGDGRAAVETVLADLDARAARGESRLGGKWVGPDVMAEAAGKAAGHFAKSVEMIRLGNLKLAEQELRQASHADPASGRANFLLGLAFMMGTKPDFDEAARDFEEVVRREPDHGAAWNNLGICNVQKRRYPAAVTAFRSASTLLQDPQPVVGNLGLVIRMATDRRSRISENQLDEVSSLYHQLLQAGGVTAPEAITGPIVLLADGAPLAGGLGDLRSLIPPAGIPQAAGEVAGVVIAPGILACSVSPKLLAGDAGLTVALPDGRSVPAGVAGKSADGSIVLLKCEGLDAAPLPLLPTSPSAGDPVLIVVPSSATAAAGGAVPPLARGTVLTAAEAVERSRFVYELQDGSGTDVVHEQAVLIVDEAGRVAGMGVHQPLARRVGLGRRLGLPVESIRKLLAAIDPSLTAVGREGEADKPAADEVAARCRAAILWIKAGNTAGAAP